MERGKCESRMILGVRDGSGLKMTLGGELSMQRTEQGPEAKGSLLCPRDNSDRCKMG